MTEAPTLPPPDADAAELLRLFCQAIKPDPRRTVAEWAEAHRIVTEGPHAGPWSNRLTPYLIEPMERATLAHPARRVSIQGPAQAGKTQIGLNLQGQILTETPAKVLVLLPSLNSARMYNRDKLEPMLAETPALSAAVADLTSRDGTGNTTTVKRGARGAQVEIVTASSSKDLQSRTVRVVINEEVTEFPVDVDNRGDPVDMAMARTLAFREIGEKVVDISTPGIKGACRISRYWEEGSAAEYHVDCPHCRQAQIPRIAQLHTPRARNADGTEGPLQHDEARYACEHCGVLIEQADWRRTIEAGGARWVHTHPERQTRHSSYRFNVLISPFVPWSEVSRELEAATLNPIRAKAFAQQWLGEPWDEAHDLPKADILLLRRDTWPARRIPPQVVFLMGATDVQGDYLSWAVWGFDQNFGQWLIDTGRLDGDPNLSEVWTRHDELLRRRWLDAWDKPRHPEAWGIDSGGRSTPSVYAYCWRHASTKAPEVMALKGASSSTGNMWKHPPLGTASSALVDWNGKRLGTVSLHMVGTWGMKSELATALRLTEQGPGPDGWPAAALRFNEIVDRDWLEELLSEHCVAHPKTGVRSWQKVRTRNEAWDLAVYTRALARNATLGFTDQHWANLAASRQGPPAEAQPDLATFWAPDLKAQAEAAVRDKIERATQAAAVAPQPAPHRHPPPAWAPRINDDWMPSTRDWA